MSRELSEQEENSEEKRSPKWQKVTEVTVTKSLKQWKLLSSRVIKGTLSIKTWKSTCN